MTTLKRLSSGPFHKRLISLVTPELILEWMEKDHEFARLMESARALACCATPLREFSGACPTVIFMHTGYLEYEEHVPIADLMRSNQQSVLIMNGTFGTWMPPGGLRSGQKYISEWHASVLQELEVGMRRIEVYPTAGNAMAETVLGAQQLGVRENLEADGEVLVIIPVAPQALRIVCGWKKHAPNMRFTFVSAGAFARDHLEYGYVRCLRELMRVRVYASQGDIASPDRQTRDGIYEVLRALSLHHPGLYGALAEEQRKYVVDERAFREGMDIFSTDW